MKAQGAVLLAVMRGRSSEGVDFLDDCARAVVVVGIPYPPLYETSVRLKRSFNQDHEALLGSGDDWYAAEAFRAVNQAIGESFCSCTLAADLVLCLCIFLHAMTLTVKQGLMLHWLCITQTIYVFVMWQMLSSLYMH